MNIKNKLYISAGVSIVLVVALVSIVSVKSARIAEEEEVLEIRAYEQKVNNIWVKTQFAAEYMPKAN